MPERDPLAVDFAGLAFRTPLALLSGCVGFGDEYSRVAGFSLDEVGAVCLKGTTLEPRLGSPPHRLAETPDGLLNAIGLQNPGVDAVLAEHLPGLDFGAACYFANVSGATAAEYAEVTRRFDDSPVHGIEVNVSCPNVAAGGMEFGNDPAAAAAVTAACRAATAKPLMVKLSPNHADIGAAARACVDAGADALAAINTVAGLAIDAEARRPVLGRGAGGLSGPAIKPIALLKVREARAAAPATPILGQGGVLSAADAVEFLLAGATAVGVGTGLFHDPLLCAEINQGLRDYLARHGFASVQELTGALEWPADAEADAAQPASGS